MKRQLAAVTRWSDQARGNGSLAGRSPALNCILIANSAGFATKDAPMNRDPGRLSSYLWNLRGNDNKTDGVDDISDVESSTEHQVEQLIKLLREHLRFGRDA
jgi:hypothetical protein